MTDEMDSVLDSWVADWQSTGTDSVASLDNIRRHVQRTSRRAAVGNIGVGLVLITIFTGWAVIDPQPVLIVAAVAVLLFVFIAFGFELWNRRATWKSATLSTREFVDLTHRHLSARLRALHFAWGLLAAETAFFIPWIAWTVDARDSATLRRFILSYTFLALMGFVYAFVLIRLQRHTRQQVERVRELDHSLRDESV